MLVDQSGFLLLSGGHLTDVGYLLLMNEKYWNKEWDVFDILT